MRRRGIDRGLIPLAGLAVLAVTVWQVSKAHHEVSWMSSRLETLPYRHLWPVKEEVAQLKGSAGRQVQAAGMERFSRPKSSRFYRRRHTQPSTTGDEASPAVTTPRRSAMDVWNDEQDQGPDMRWGFGEADRQETGPQGIKDVSKAGNRPDSAHIVPRDYLQAESLGLLPSLKDKNDTDAEGLPQDFDWQAYLAYYPDLLVSGIGNEAEAERHYLKHGRQEGRIHKRLKVLMHYTACTGLINQHYSHIAAFTLSSAIGAELVMAPGLQRDSFGSYFSAHEEQNEVTWTEMSTGQLYDVDRIIEEWHARGMDVHPVSILHPSASSPC